MLGARPRGFCHGDMSNDGSERLIGVLFFQMPRRFINMQLSLKPELQRYIEEQVKEGRFASESDLIEAAVARLMLDPSDDDFDDARIAAINRSLDDIAIGRVRPFEEAAAELRRKHLGR